MKALLNHDSVKAQYAEAKEHRSEDPHLLEDVRDGKIFKDKEIFMHSVSSVSIILYQDAFEVVNPLGSRRKKHKQLAVYMTLSEISPHHRSSIDPKQLVMLCKEEDFKFFGQEKVFGPLVKDLRDLEDTGVELNSGQIMQGAVLAIVGDNLGSHTIGGFSENFSKSKHFCRYCLIDRESFQKSPTELGLTRTKQTYKTAVDDLSKNGQLNYVDGIKFDSVFNSLKHFHVCDPGLPPCLGHNLFEGVVSMDLSLYIKHLVTVGKHFTYTQLNRNITT